MAAPSKPNGINSYASLSRTLPFSKYITAENNDKGIMTATELACAVLVDRPWCFKIGTASIPPPAPSKPLAKPDAAPPKAVRKIFLDLAFIRAPFRGFKPIFPKINGYYTNLNFKNQPKISMFIIFEKML